MVALLVAQWAWERCRFVTEHVPTPALPPALGTVDHLLIRRALCMTQEVRELQGALARPFRIYFAEESLPILCDRLEEARRLSVAGKLREAGAKYQALLLASQVFELAIAVHAFSEYADQVGVPSPRIMEMQELFVGQIGPLLAAALREDPAQMRRALAEHGAQYGAWVDALGRWSAKVEREAQRIRVARIIWDIGMLAIATYEAAGEAAEIAASRQLPGPPIPAFAGAGGAAAAQLSATASVELAEALRQLIASGALDAGVVIGLSHLASGQGGRTQIPTRLLMERLDPATIKPGMELDPAKEPIFSRWRRLHAQTRRGQDRPDDRAGQTDSWRVSRFQSRQPGAIRWRPPDQEHPPRAQDRAAWSTARALRDRSARADESRPLSRASQPDRASLMADEHPQLIFGTPFDERAQFEARSKGYLSDVLVKQADGSTYSVVFYDCTRLAQDLEYEVSTGRMCVADLGMIVLPEVTVANMKAAIERLAKEGYFDGLRPTKPPERTSP
jgi:hypothetical protein